MVDSFESLFTLAVTKLEDGGIFAAKIVFIDKSTLQISGFVTRYNVRILVNKHQDAVTDGERDTSKFRVFYAVSNRKMCGPSFFPIAL